MGKVELSGGGIKIDGKSEVLLCASLFYFRIPRALWERRIIDLKATGYNCVDVYFPWNFHEVSEGVFDFDGEKDIDAFLQLCAKYELYVIARPGPYICSEWDGGALPSRICSNFNIRQNDKAYLCQVEKWFNAVMPLISKNETGRGGSVILLQLENELDFFDCKDVDGMISALRDMAKCGGISVPMFCCAGQSDSIKAGGWTKDVYPTFNFYPNSKSRDFDVNCAYYNDKLKEKDMPLLVSETQREHALLKRELLCGAKLLGAYNQVAGSNFEYFQSINNWGKPLSIITTRYDFGSMITTLGDFNREADEGIAFAQMIRALGSSLAEAQRCDMPLEIEKDFTSPHISSALRLKDGGYILGLINVGDTDGKAVIDAKELGKIEVDVPFNGAMALPYKAKLCCCTVEFSSYEIFSMSNKTLILTGSGRKYAAITADGKVYRLNCDGTAGDITVKFMSKQQAVREYCKNTALNMAYADMHSFAYLQNASLSDMKYDLPFKESSSLRLCDNGIYAGGMEAQISISPDSQLYLENVSDFMTVYSDGVGKGKLYGGESVIVPAAKDGKFRLRVEKWGHSNFDDPRRKSLYIKAARGIEGAYEIKDSLPLNRWQFINYYEWKPQALNYEKNDFHPRLDPNSWNSTRLPLIGLYYITLNPEQCDKSVIFIEGGEAEACLYCNGKLIDEFHIHDKALDITKYVCGKEQTFELLVRKREWTQKVGDVKLLSLKKCAFKTRPFSRNEVLNATSENYSLQSFPLCFKGGDIKVALLDLGEFKNIDCYGVTEGSGFKLTAVYGEKIIARMVAPDEDINQQGGSDTQFLIPSCYKGEKLKLVIEGLKDGELNFKLEYNKNLK